MQVILKKLNIYTGPEGILFYYLSQTYKEHSENGEETIIVFDMGGATINASVFKLYLEKKSRGTFSIKYLHCHVWGMR